MNFENWSACTATLKRLFDVHRQYLPDYMDEQMWRSRHPVGGMIIFRHILPHFTMERVHKGLDQEFLRRTSQRAWGQKSPSGVQGLSPLIIFIHHTMVAAKHKNKLS